MYRLYAFAAKVVPHLPRGMVLALGQVIGLAAWLVAGKARRQATANIRHVLDADIQSTRAGRKRLRATVRGMFQYSVRNYLEAFYLPAMKPEVIHRELDDIAGIEYLEEALAKGKGVIIISAHLGPFNYLSQWFAVSTYTVTIPVEHLKDQRMLDLFLSLRRRQGVNFAPLGGSAPLRAIIAALRKNEVVLITGDRAIVGESVERDFFGAPARLPSGPISLALRTGAMVVGAVGCYKKKGRIGGHFTPISLAMPEEERVNEERLHAKVVEMMEREIRRHPEQWLVFAPVWED